MLFQVHVGFLKFKLELQLPYQKDCNYKFKYVQRGKCNRSLYQQRDRDGRAKVSVLRERTA